MHWAIKYEWYFCQSLFLLLVRNTTVFSPTWTSLVHVRLLSVENAVGTGGKWRVVREAVEFLAVFRRLGVAHTEMELHRIRPDVGLQIVCRRYRWRTPDYEEKSDNPHNQQHTIYTPIHTVYLLHTQYISYTYSTSPVRTVYRLYIQCISYTYTQCISYTYSASPIHTVSRIRTVYLLYVQCISYTCTVYGRQIWMITAAHTVFLSKPGYAGFLYCNARCKLTFCNGNFAFWMWRIHIR